MALCAAFVFLGRWQWRKGELRQLEWDRFAKGTEVLLPLGARSVASVPRFQHVSVTGRFDSAHQFLLDNRGYQGHAGFEVLTPLARPDELTLLIDRGWVPFSGRRDRLPDVTLAPTREITLTGRVADLPSPGLASGRAPPGEGSPWPKVTSFPDMGQLSAALARPLEPHILLLDPGAGPGYVRDWHPPGMEPIRHWSYAVQWWGFAVVTLGLWVGLNLKRSVAP